MLVEHANAIKKEFLRPNACSPSSTDFGYLTLAAGMEHGALHVIRYAIRGETDLLYTTNTGRSGVICTLLLFPVVLPMKYQWFKDRVRKDETSVGLC